MELLKEKTVTSPAAGSNGASKPSPQPPRPGVQKSVFFRTVPAEAAARRPEASRVQQLVYPEVSDSAYGMQHIRKKPSLGLAMSGGGFRAATCAAGWTRGLQKTLVQTPQSPKAGGKNEVSVLSQTKYIATTSGGSWFNAALSYTGGLKEQVPLDQFLGEVMKPEELGPGVISELPPEGSFDRVLAEHSVLDSLLGDMKLPLIGPILAVAKKKVGDVLEDIFGARDAGEPTHRPRWVSYWTHGVAETFLAPYGLNIYEDCTLTAKGTEGNIHKTAERIAKHTLVACEDANRPYPIFMGTAFNPPGDDGYQGYPFEFTPLYFGTPGAFPRSDPPLGGGYTEPWALNSIPKTTCDDNGEHDCTCSTGEVMLDRTGKNSKGYPFHTVPLAQAMSISSSFLAAGFHWSRPFTQTLASTEELCNWGLMNTETGAPPAHKDVGFADGAMVDNLGISALLRRGVKCMIVCAAVPAGPDDTWERYAEEASDVACWFGAARACYTPRITASELNDNCQVFGKDRREGEELFQDLFDDVHTKLRSGRPGFHRGSYRVHESHYHNIPASKEGERVEVLWIFNHQFGEWEDKLPAETKQQLLDDRRGQGIHPKGVMKREFMEGELWDFWGGGFMTQNNLDRFPYFTTFSLDFSPAAVHMLGQLSSAVILDPEVQKHIRELVDIAGNSGDE